LGCDAACGGLLPQDKLEILENLKATARSRGKNHLLAFAGDGVNDAPSIAAADVGIAMGPLGSDAAVEAADIVINSGSLDKINTALDTARATRRIVTQNIVFALGVKVVLLALGALGLASMWAAVFADTGVALLAVLNSARVLTTKSH
jgi:Cd2+/Zn2+-exporting ATPase